MPLILVVGKLLGIHQVERFRDVADVQVTVERYLNLSFLSTLGGYHYNTITTLGTVNSRQGGVLKNVDRSDVRRRNIIDVVNLETIDNEQRVVFLCH